MNKLLYRVVLLLCKIVFCNYSKEAAIYFLGRLILLKKTQLHPFHVLWYNYFINLFECCIQEEDTGWEWQTLCKEFLFEYHVPSLERVFEEQYGGDLRKFLRDYLEPVLGLLENVRSSAEVHLIYVTVLVY